MAQPAGTVWVVVLGDFGRSPRMQYHCLSLLQLYDSKIHVFTQTTNLQGILPELLAAKGAGRLNLWPILQMCVPSDLCWCLYYMASRGVLQHNHSPQNLHHPDGSTSSVSPHEITSMPSPVVRTAR